MKCVYCGADISDSAKYCTECGKPSIASSESKAGQTSACNKQAEASAGTAPMSSATHARLAVFYTCAVILLIAMSIVIQMINHVERGFTVDEIIMRVLLGTTGFVIALAGFAIWAWKRNGLSFEKAKAARGGIGIALAYLIMFAGLFLASMSTPAVMSNIDSYYLLVEWTSTLKVVCIALFVVTVAIWGYYAYKGINIAKDKDAEMVIPILFGAIGSVPVILLVASIVGAI